MTIAIDGYEANVENRVGIGRYAFEIIKHLHYKADKGDIKWHIFLPTKPKGDMPRQTARWKYTIARPAKFWTFIGLPFALSQANPKPDVVFSPTHYIPRFISIPRVMAIMDLSYLEFPGMFKTKDLQQLVRGTAYSAQNSRAILTISEFSKRAIIKAYNIPKERVIVAYPGLTMPTKNEYTNSPNITGDYILSVGTLQPRKNFSRLIEAFSVIAKKFPNLDLVIVGKKGWLYGDILASPQQFGVEDRVKFLDFVEDSQLAELYKKAKVFALPSLYEGFGLPVLEAMSYGTPVVVSNVSSLPEIAGVAGIYVDPQNPQAIAEGLTEALTQNSSDAKKRQSASQSQVKKFTWEHAAEQTFDVLTKVGKGEL